jgi:MRG/RNA binding activity-knot of a chromodomain
VYSEYVLLRILRQDPLIESKNSPSKATNTLFHSVPVVLRMTEMYYQQQVDPTEPSTNDVELSAMMESAEPSSPKYSVEEKVLCPDQETMYEGIIRKYQYKKNGWRYLVHYLGWNARWDKWLDEKDILEASDENVKAMKSEQKKRKRAASDVPEAPSTKPKTSTTISTVVKGRPTPSLADCCELPFTLKTILADDKERIMRLGFEGGYDCNTPWTPARDVHVLPAAVTIHTVLEHYIKLQKKTGPNDGDGAEHQQFVSSLSELFEEALPVCLLYPPERAQFLAIRKRLPDQPLVDVYGCEFLLRLLVRLPTLMLDAASVGQPIASLIVVLQKNRMACFKPKYREPLREEWNDWEVALRKQSKAQKRAESS